MLSEDYHAYCLKHISNSIQYCNENLFSYKKHKLDIQYESTKEMTFNAYCRLLSKGSYKVNIYSEVFEKVFDVLNNLLNEGNIVFYNKVSLESKYDLKRANFYLDILHEMSCKLIIYHELGHIFNGHLDYYHSIGHNSKKSLLFMNSEKNQLDFLESQVLEMDADAFAATYLIGQFIYPDTIEKYNEYAPGLIKGELHAFILVIISSCVVFSLMGLGGGRISKNYLQSKYLPLRTRQDQYIRCAIQAYKLYGKEIEFVDPELLNIEFYREVLVNVEDHVNLYCREVFQFEKADFDSSNNKSELDKELLDYADYLDVFWSKEMRNKLKPFAYFYLAE